MQTPNIDLGGKFKVITEVGGRLVWKTLGYGFATEANARRVAKQHGVKEIWIFDDCGERRLITGV
jgi:hypothetical protein